MSEGVGAADLATLLTAPKIDRPAVRAEMARIVTIPDDQAQEQFTRAQDQVWREIDPGRRKFQAAVLWLVEAALQLDPSIRSVVFDNLHEKEIL